MAHWSSEDSSLGTVWLRPGRVVFTKKGSRRVVLTKKRKCRLIDETCRLIVETCSLLVGTCRYISLCFVFSAQLAHSWLDFSGIIVYIHVDSTYKKKIFFYLLHVYSWGARPARQFLIFWTLAQCIHAEEGQPCLCAGPLADCSQPLHVSSLHVSSATSLHVSPYTAKSRGRCSGSIDR